MRIKDKVKDKIKMWFFKDQIEKLNTLEYHHKELYEEIYKCNKNLKEAYKVLDETQKLMNSITEVAVDVGFYDNHHSWAVVCIDGKPEYVKFMPLTGKDARSIIEFLKHFKYSRSIIDSPFAFKDFLKGYVVDNF